MRHPPLYKDSPRCGYDPIPFYPLDTLFSLKIVLVPVFLFLPDQQFLPLNFLICLTLILI